MFDAITRQHGGKRRARGLAFVLGSAGLQALLVAAVAVASRGPAARAGAGPVVAVKLFPDAAAPPPPAAPGGAQAARAALAERKKPLHPAPLVEPEELPPTVEPAAAPEPAPQGEDGGSPEGSAGGMPGGSPGGVAGGVPGATGDGTGPGGNLEEAPQYATAAFRKPSLARPGCLRDALRLPPQLAQFVSGPITVKFAVGRDGSVGLVKMVTSVPDRRIEEAIQAGLKACRWTPGADPRGQPVRLWVILPIQFTSS